MADSSTRHMCDNPPLECDSDADTASSMEVDDLPGGGEGSICQPSAANIGSLPEEMLIHILSYLSPSELCSTVPKVCTLWEAVHGDSRLYREVTFRQGDGIDVIDTCMSFATSVKSFTLIADDIYNMVQILRLQSVYEGIGKQLRSLTLKLTQPRCLYNQNYFTPRDLEKTILGLLTKCFKLEILHLELFYLDSDIVYSNFFSPNNPTFSLEGLRIVRLMNSTGFLKDTLEHIGSKCLKLEELSVYDDCTGRSTCPTTLTSKELHSLCTRRCDTLRSLHLNYSSWYTEALSSLNLCRCLQDLSFYNAYELSDEGLLVIASLNGLRSLKLSGCKEITEGGWSLMMKTPAMKGLESLVLDEVCGASNSTAIAIGENLHNLKMLSLCSYRASFLLIPFVSTTGLHSIMKGCPQLEELSLFQIDTIALVDFLQIPMHLPKLQKITIDARPDNEHIWLTILKKRMPLLKVICK